MPGFTPFDAIAGGLLIGLAVVGMLWFNGRVTGISGIFGGLLAAPSKDTLWRGLFIAGLIGGVVMYRALGGPLTDIGISSSMPLLIVGGVLVGFGARLGSGCTSGHAICGIARFSGRSLVATLIFMASAGVSVFVLRHLVGG